MKIGKIEKYVKMPTVPSRFKYPWPDMEVGDSVIIAANKGESLTNLMKKVRPSAYYYGDLTGKKFKTLIAREDCGVRVGRIE